MTDEEYIERAAAVLTMEEEMLADGKSPEDIDAFFRECREYDFAIVSAQMIEDGSSPEQVASFWEEINSFYDRIETYNETDDDVGAISLQDVILIILVLVVVAVIIGRF